MHRGLIFFYVIAALVAGGLAVFGGLYAWKKLSVGLPTLAEPVSAEAFAASYQKPLAHPRGPMRVYFLGHSLTGRDMPAILAQRVAGHSYESQLGWGTSLREHWEPYLAVNGDEVENAHPRYRPVREALPSADYDALVMTEMSSPEAALTWHATPYYIAEISNLARQMRPDIRIYLYQNWRNLDEPAGWAEQTTADLKLFWEDEFLRRAQAHGSGTVYLIPGGKVLVAAALAAEAGRLPGLSSRTDFFGTNEDGTVDRVHLSPIGNYLIALVHEAVLYHVRPEGSPWRFSRPDGPDFEIPPETGAALQALVWEVVLQTPQTGVAP